MSLRDKLKSKAVEVIQEPTTGPPPVIGGPDEEVSLFDAVMGRQEPKRHDGVKILTGEEEIAAHLDNLSEAQRAGYAAQAEIARQRQVPDA